jgi:flagellar hook assembly protein FlgD
VIIRNSIINPHRGEVTTINITIQKREKVTVTVYDLAGDPVKKLFSKTADVGLNEVPWDGKNKRGRKVVQGVYYVVTKVGKERYVHKVLMVR